MKLCIFISTHCVVFNLMRNPFLSFLLIFFSFVATPILAQEESEEKEEEKVDYIIRKGRAYTTLNFVYSTRDAENENQLLRTVVAQDKYDFRVIAAGGYALRDNLTLGLSAALGRTKEEITTLDENSQLVTSNKLETGYTVAPTFRNYVPIGKGQLQILVQTELGVTFGETLERVTRVDDQDRIEGEFGELSLGVSPGLVLFFDRHWAFETTVGIAGFSTRVDEKVTNGDVDNKSRVVQSSFDLRINLLQLNLGVAYYF